MTIQKPRIPRVPRRSTVLASLFALGALGLFVSDPDITFDNGWQSDTEYHLEAECDSVSFIAADIGQDLLDLEGNGSSETYEMSSQSDSDELLKLEEKAEERNTDLDQSVSDQIDAGCDRKRTGYVGMMGLLLAPTTIFSVLSLRSVGRREQDGTRQDT